MKSLPTGTVTFLFTDIEGSTALLQRLGDRRYADVLEEHRRLLRAAFEEAHGQEVARYGDAFLVAFSRATEAVGAAVAAQRSLVTHRWPDRASLRVRMGLHTGEAVSAAGDYAGLEVHRASRICSVGHGGQILLSQTVADLATPYLPPGVSLRDLGMHRLKDLRDPEHLFQVVHPELPAEFPPLTTLSARPNNLPLQLTSFVGREREIADVKRLLGVTRLVTLTGSGGAGKTRLALQVAADVLDGYPDGVWLVEFAPVTDTALVPKTVAAAIGVPEQPGREMLETLVDALRPKAVLFVLDNCEHVLAACADLTVALLRACPQLRILATSREGLGVPGETLWRVPSLSLPDPRRLPPLEDVVQYEAVRLFVERAMATVPRFTVRSENAPAVAQVCQRLDGIPLAIELAAARVKVLAVEQILARLNDRFVLLTGGSRTALPRQQTLRAAMDWSYDLLSERERMLFRRVSVFAGGWTLEAAEAVCSGKGLTPVDVLELLTQLVDKSLLIVEMRDGQAWYRLLETVREHGGTRLRGSGEAEEVRTRHRDWYLALAEQAEPALHGPEQGAWLERLESEHDNFRAALQWCIDAGEGEPGLRLASALWWFWHVRGHNREGLERLQTTLRSIGAPLLLRARAHRGLGYLATALADFATARAALQEALTIGRALDDTSGIADSLYELGRMVFLLRDLDGAAGYYDEARNLFQTVGDRIGLARVLNSLGYLAAQQRDFTTARARYTECLSICQATGDKWLIGYAKGNLGVAARNEGAYEAARSFHLDALRIWQELKTPLGLIAGLEDLGLLAAAQAQARRAACLLGAAEAHLERFGLRLPIDSVNVEIGEYMAGLGAALGEEAAAARLAEGRKMPLEQAVAYALSDEDT